jgi:hypothetical protein
MKPCSSLFIQSERKFYQDTEGASGLFFSKVLEKCELLEFLVARYNFRIG